MHTICIDSFEKLMEITTEKKKTYSLPFMLDLQINIHHTDKSIKKNSIIGIGGIRDNAYIPLTELLK